MELGAHLIQSDDEAIRVAQGLAADFALDASERDRKRRLPYQEIERYSRSGVWGITVPKEYGGADVSAVTLAEVVAIISAADPSLGQIPQNHYFFLQLIRTNASDEQKRFFYDRVLRGQRLGNALSELGTKTVGDYNTRVVRDQGAFLLFGRKYYSTGALFATGFQSSRKTSTTIWLLRLLSVARPVLRLSMIGTVLVNAQPAVEQ